MNVYFAIPLLPGGNLEWLIVIMAALMIFGSRLPEVALRAVAHVMRIRRMIAKMWQDTGLEDELRRVRRDIELSIPREADFKVKKPTTDAQKTNEARAAAERAREAAERNARNQVEAAKATEFTEADEPSVDPDAHRRGEFRLEPAEGIVGNGDWQPEEDTGPDPGPAPSLDLDPARRDQIPGVDRQEPTTYYEEEPYNDDEPAAPDLAGDRLGAGVKPPPAGEAS
ncbi:hypothetical protein Poly30_54120 [Planctomycetes bacterium Poly30]|uniref:Sec-independent protein translocase protein TatB n=1 Tax=Saltatorellus ferox TaxID=2528018 RepID=A0A518F0I5_9BACT|nr:hypothetical protein Poly30_54120 [Planctomycetes bacterium Poly30]